MNDYQKYITALRKCAKEHEGYTTFTGRIIVTDLCRDTANLLEELAQEPKTQMVDKSNFDIEQYKMDLQCAYDCGRASVEPKTENYDADFLEFLFNVINPNEMEKYMAMYNSPNIPTEGSEECMQ